MSRTRALCVLAASVVLTVPHHAVLSAPDCVTEPKPSISGHWYYHVDSVTKRKCWFVDHTEVQRSTPPTQISPTPKGDTSGPRALDPNAKSGKSAQEQRNPNTRAHSSPAPKRQAEAATVLADCEVQALKVYDDEKKAFMKDCIGADER
jgi:hypothetical protein